MKLLFLLSFVLCSCQNKEQINVLINKSFIKLDSIDNKLLVDDRCGSEAPNIKIFKDYIYYYYPTEGLNYKIIQFIESKNSFIYKAIVQPSSDSATTKFEFFSQRNGLFKLYIDNQYSGLFVDSLRIGKDYQIFHRNDCGSDELDIDETNKTFKNILGKWKFDCEDARDMNVEDDKKIFLVVQGNQIAVSMIKLDKSTETEFYYRLDKKPLEMGRGGASLPWETYLNNTEIAKIKILNKAQIEFTWYGFYNNKTKEREMTDCEFTMNSGENPVVLTKCE